MPTAPPGISDRVFATALRRFEEVVGREWVFSRDEDVALYRDAYSPLWSEEEDRVASAAVAPRTVEEVQGIVRVANEFKVPVYPISTGKNLTYGGSAPVYSGSVVVDLKRMNRILDVSERDETCLVEPGVSYFDLYRHLRQNQIKLWIDCPDPGWGGLIGNALDRGGGYTSIDFRDHFDAHCGMEVVLPTGDVVRTGLGANSRSKAWQHFKYGMGPWVDGIFSQSNYGIVTKMGFWLMREPKHALSVSVSAFKHSDLVEFLNVLTRLMNDHTIQSQVGLFSPLMSFATPELIALRTKESVTEQEWAAYAASRNQPFWTASFSFYGAPKLVAAAWEQTRDEFSAISGVQFQERGAFDFPMTDEQVESVGDKAPFGIPSLALFGSRNAPNAPPSEGHMDFAAVIAPRGEDVLAYADVVGKFYASKGLGLPGLFGQLYHPRVITMFQVLQVFRDKERNRQSRELFSELLDLCAENGWTVYRTHSHFQRQAMQAFDFNDHSLLRLHETLKDALDPNGIMSAGRYGIWPKHLRGGTL